LELWNKCSEKLENKLSQEDFNTWIRPLKATQEENTLELLAPNDFILNYIEKNFFEEIQQLVKANTKKNISLVFKTLTKETFVDKYKNNRKTLKSNL
tara:strand:+ start:86 stop:376 length:291 start_codon:yes stop_codon:yes gene_type:complete